LTTFPAKDHHVVLYLQHLAETTGSKAAVEETVYAIAWAHNLASTPSPTESSVKATLEGLSKASDQEGAHHCGYAQGYGKRLK